MAIIGEKGVGTGAWPPCRHCWPVLASSCWRPRPMPWVLQVWFPRGRAVPMASWGSHVFPPGFPSQATAASMQPVRKVLFRYVLTQRSIVLAAWLELPSLSWGCSLGPVLGRHRGPCSVDRRTVPTGAPWHSACVDG